MPFSTNHKIQLVDASGDKCDQESDDGHTSGDVGIMSLAVRNNTLGTLVGTDRDYTPLQVNTDGALYTLSEINATTGTTNAFQTANGAVATSQRGIVPLIRMNDVVSAPTGHVDNDWTYFQTNIKGALYTTGGEVENAAVQSEPLLIGGRYDLSARTLGSGDAGAVALTAKGEVIVSVPTASNSWITREDYATLQVNAQGALYTTHGVTGMQSDNNEAVDDTTAVALGGLQACKRVDMQADSANTGYIYVGGTDVSATKGIRFL